MATAPTSSIEALLISVIPHNLQRYPTVGDWYHDFHADTQRISVSKLGDWRYEFLVALHEMVEMAVCRAEGVTEKQVDEWDLAHPDAEEPGELPGCPYREAHAFASQLERMMAIALGVDWVEYEEKINGLP